MKFQKFVWLSSARYSDISRRRGVISHFASRTVVTDFCFRLESTVERSSRAMPIRLHIPDHVMLREKPAVIRNARLEQRHFSSQSM
ncbi:unnamed protein product, partial [Nesidiocoris tenuis]